MVHGLISSGVIQFFAGYRVLSWAFTGPSPAVTLHRQGIMMEGIGLDDSFTPKDVDILFGKHTWGKHGAEVWFIPPPDVYDFGDRIDGHLWRQHNQDFLDNIFQSLMDRTAVPKTRAQWVNMRRKAGRNQPKDKKGNLAVTEAWLERLIPLTGGPIDDRWDYDSRMQRSWGPWELEDC